MREASTITSMLLSARAARIGFWTGIAGAIMILAFIVPRLFIPNYDPPFPLLGTGIIAFMGGFTRHSSYRLRVKHAAEKAEAEAKAVAEAKTEAKAKPVSDAKAQQDAIPQTPTNN